MGGSLSHSGGGSTSSICAVFYNFAVSVYLYCTVYLERAVFLCELGVVQLVGKSVMNSVVVKSAVQKIVVQSSTA